MKKCIAIVLISVYVLNVVGYHGLFFGWSLKNDRIITQSLDADLYSGADAITLRIPLSLPYPVAQTNYERIEGSFEHLGETYRMVKQKLHLDTMYLVCVKDKVDKTIKEAYKGYLQSMTDKDTSSSTNKSVVIIKDYLSFAYPGNEVNDASSTIITATLYINLYNHHIISSSDKPPKWIA